jgi:hypothetical protein
MSINEEAMGTKRTIPADEELCRTVGQSAPGAQIPYYQGFLPADASAQGLGGRDVREVQRVAECARQLAAEGTVHLLQRRNADGDYTYIAVVRRRRPCVSEAQRQLSAVVASRCGANTREAV